MRHTILFVLAIVFTGCASDQKINAESNKKLQEPKSATLLKDLEYKDQFLAVPPVLPHYFQETPQSKAVIAGSRFYANSNYCEFIRRYKVKTNVDFNSAINLFKYRAYFMGASRVVFVDSDARLLRDQSDVEIIFHPALPKEGSSVSVLIGDLYECPANRNALY